MNIYSAENIEYILRELLKKEGMSSVLPENFKSQKENIRVHKDHKKEYVKKLRNLKRELARTRQNNVLDSSLKSDKERELLLQLDDLEPKINEESAIVDDLEKKWNESIEENSLKILIGIRSKHIKPFLKSFELFGHTTFTTADLYSKIIEQLIKDDIAKHYKRKPADRNCIIEQLKGLLGNKLPKFIIRADIKSFFESVPMESLIEKLEKEGYISSISIRYLKWISKDMKAMGGGNGVPRGLSFSSYLTEIYLQRIDEDVRSMPNLYFYQRYVDDIVMLFSIDKDLHRHNYYKEAEKYWEKLKEIFRKKELILHEDGKKKSLIYSGKTTDKNFDYLGYKFIINEGKLTIKLSDSRMDRYRNKIDAVFGHYNSNARDNRSLTNVSGEDGARRRKRQQPLKRLFGQLSALTGNGMLKGPKSNILTGIYYSNPHISTMEDLYALDRLLAHYISDHLEIPNNLFRYEDGSRPDETIKSIKDMMIKKWAFVDGFMNRRFCNNASYFNRLNQIKKLCQ